MLVHVPSFEDAFLARLFSLLVLLQSANALAIPVLSRGQGTHWREDGRQRKRKLEPESDRHKQEKARAGVGSLLAAILGRDRCKRKKRVNELNRETINVLAFSLSLVRKTSEREREKERTSSIQREGE